MKYFRYYLWFVSVELILLFSFGCTAPREEREERGDWMEHLNYKQFNFQPLSIHWDRHNYYSEEELKQMWIEAYNKAQADLLSLKE